ncbi:hypothetical protein EKG39_06805 [Shewanella atlantica]|uniref:Uncharacterized protein n=1 Tax=Shewanella atlantica TaxID=271099 RepID=A0A3S0IE27_9GAMM|nr:hypothetical protein EKG39_06805 [Shewanella atlantica]
MLLNSGVLRQSSSLNITLIAYRLSLIAYRLSLIAYNLPLITCYLLPVTKLSKHLFRDVHDAGMPGTDLC